MQKIKACWYAKKITANDPTHSFDEMVTLLTQHGEEFAENVLAVSEGVARRRAVATDYD
ncbi:hypothetical protein ACRYI5_00940 [Furfurilactobacillus sp. WILCCON 0119]